MSRKNDLRQTLRLKAEADRHGMTLRDFIALQEANAVVAEDMRKHPLDYDYLDLQAVLGVEGAAKAMMLVTHRGRRRWPTTVLAALGGLVAGAGLAAGALVAGGTDLGSILDQEPTQTARPTRTPRPTATPDRPRLTAGEVVSILLTSAVTNGNKAICSRQPVYEGRGMWDCGNFKYDERADKIFINDEAIR